MPFAMPVDIPPDYAKTEAHSYTHNSGDLNKKLQELLNGKTVLIKGDEMIIFSNKLSKKPFVPPSGVGYVVEKPLVHDDGTSIDGMTIRISDFDMDKRADRYDLLDRNGIPVLSYWISGTGETKSIHTLPGSTLDTYNKIRPADGFNKWKEYDDALKNPQKHGFGKRKVVSPSTYNGSRHYPPLRTPNDLTPKQGLHQDLSGKIQGIYRAGNFHK